MVKLKLILNTFLVKYHSPGCGKRQGYSDECNREYSDSTSSWEGSTLHSDFLSNLQTGFFSYFAGISTVFLLFQQFLISTLLLHLFFLTDVKMCELNNREVSWTSSSANFALLMMSEIFIRYFFETGVVFLRVETFVHSSIALRLISVKGRCDTCVWNHSCMAQG